MRFRFQRDDSLDEDDFGAFVEFWKPRPIKVPHAEVPPDAPCCEKNEDASRRECSLCGRPVCLRCRGHFNGTVFLSRLPQ